MTEFDNDRPMAEPAVTDAPPESAVTEFDAVGTPAPPPRAARPWWQGAWAGLAAGGLAVAIGMLIAAITDVVSPIDAVGSEVIDRTPRAVKEWAIREFGTNDKLVLRIGIFSVLALAALVIGALAVRRVWIGVAGIGAFGVVGALAAAGRPGEGAGSAVPSLLGAVAGAAVIYALLHRRPMAVPGPSAAPLGWDRRQFLITSGTTAVVAAAAGAVAHKVTSNREREFVSQAAEPIPEFGDTGITVDIPAGADADPNTPFLTPNDDFYRIDTALSFPRADVANWSFTIEGMVDNPLTITYADLLNRPQVEKVITICCVSNEVGGRYIGNAVWRGVMLRDLLEEAGVQDGAEQVYSTSL
ncbi:MAG: molybdopterin-dependent oxidoreductase, partial [Ilumatobacter sp.]|nr:molybdopterin-dependent oxidoreductase [Ilumatobacter sp.]